jgi:hypothetical protein
MKGILTQLLKSPKSGLRTPRTDIEVAFKDLPRVGERFACFGEGIDFGLRWISTSPVTKVRKTGPGFSHVLEFFTSSGSVYRLIGPDQLVLILRPA